MRGMVLFENAGIHSSPLRMTELPEPQPGPGEVRLRVRCCGICRTDLHVIEGELPPAKRPLIPGHQIVGVVDALGARCNRLRIGQRIGVAWLRQTCGACEFCRVGRENLCETARFTGYHADGGFAGQAVVPEDFVYELPDSLDDAQAAPLLCAGIIGYRALERSDLPRGGRLGIYGFGSSAHIVLQIAQYRGSEVFVVTRGDKHRQLAREMGAAWVGESATDMPAKVDSAIIFAPAGELVPPALEALKKGGTLALAGIYMTAIPALDYDKTIFHERNLRSVTANTREDGRKLFAEAAAANVQPRVTRYSLADANAALQDLKDDRINGTGVLMVP
jgi:alcohol dehydrogenase, propanol-preferring